jgi:type 1 fimbriae regulatory protein FimB
MRSLTITRAKGGRTSTHTLARDDLSALRKMRKATNGPWVFETERGRPLSVDAMQYIVRAADDAAGLGDAVHPHMLRHGAGYALINDGVDVRLVQEFLGHASITSTAIYTAACVGAGAVAFPDRQRLLPVVALGLPAAINSRPATS